MQSSTPTWLVRAADARRLRDDRYGTVFETCSPVMSALTQLGFAFVEIDAGAESPAHYHRRMEEIYFITEGAGQMTIGDEAVEVGPGDTINIPPGAVHKIANPGTSPLRFACATWPPYDPEDDFEVADLTIPTPP
ncbi:MAG: cupin domain-containing protein [Prosthecobacter sp.]|uniref:cupin domain-containing protein n=1 Tax=Prosthecobacter sp. TaxID=1965333 RepID=UPI0038FEF247